MKKFLVSAMAAGVITASLVSTSFAAGNGAMKKAKVTVDPSCMATAVSARDTAISTALGTVVTAIQTRGQSLSTAWTGNPTDAKARNTAIKAANSAFNGTWKTFSKARKDAWTKYASDAKACHAASGDVQSSDTTGGM